MKVKRLSFEERDSPPRWCSCSFETKVGGQRQDAVRGPGHVGAAGRCSASKRKLSEGRHHHHRHRRFLLTCRIQSPSGLRCISVPIMHPAKTNVSSSSLAQPLLAKTVAC